MSLGDEIQSQFLVTVSQYDCELIFRLGQLLESSVSLLRNGRSVNSALGIMMPEVEINTDANISRTVLSGWTQCSHLKVKKTKKAKGV